MGQTWLIVCVLRFVDKLLRIFLLYNCLGKTIACKYSEPGTIYESDCEIIMLTPQALFKLVPQVTSLLIENRLISCARALWCLTVGGVVAYLSLILVCFTTVHVTKAMDQKPYGHPGQRFIVRDTDDGWYLIDTHNPKPAIQSAFIDSDKCESLSAPTSCDKTTRLMSRVEAFLDATRTGSFEKQVDIELVKLQKNQRLLFTLIRRTEPTFVQEVIQAHTKNVASVGLDPKRAYEYFGINPEEARTLDHSYFKKIIKRERSNPNTPPKTKAELRQLEYVFANSATKQEYDSYLQGRGELEKLILSKQEAERVRSQLNQVIQYTLVLQALRVNLGSVAKAVPVHISQERLI